MKRNERIVTIETPEHVELHFKLAGIGTRMIAFLIDRLIQLGVILALGILTILVMVMLQTIAPWLAPIAGLQKVAGQWILAAAILTYGVVFIAYFILFEYIWSGATPGKRTQEIRVIRADGRPISLFDSAVRNILRFFDLLMEVYPLGLVVMFIDSRNRRLGDLAAGTLVVEESSIKRLEDLDGSAESSGRDDETRKIVAEMTAEEYRLVSRFLARRDALDPAARSDLALEIYSRIFKTSVPEGLSESEAEERLKNAVAIYTERTRIL